MYSVIKIGFSYTLCYLALICSHKMIWLQDVRVELRYYILAIHLHDLGVKFQRGFGIARYQGVMVKFSVCYYLVGLLFPCRPEVLADNFCFDLDSVSPKSFPAKFRINACTFR